MTISQSTTSGIDGVLDEPWAITNGTVVPTTDTVALKNGGRRIEATYLYADLARSSWLAQNVKDEIAAKVFRSYLNAATRLLKHFGGEIRSFDGDRVMAVFMGGQKNTNAAKAAFAIQWAVEEVIQAKLQSKWPTSLAGYSMTHGIGIDTGEALVVRGGVRNDNDLVSVGSAPNVAAKLSDIRGGPTIHITDRVHSMLLDSGKFRNDGTSTIWNARPSTEVGGKSVALFGTSYWRRP